MDRENTTEPPYTTAASSGQSSFVRPPPIAPVLATASNVSQSEQPSMSIASTGFVSQPVPSSVTAQWGSNAAASSNVNLLPQASPMLPNPPFGRPGTLAPPGLMTSPSAFPGSNPFSTTPRPGMSTGPAQINPGIHPHMYPPYHSLPTMPGTPQGMWLQPPLMGGIPRAPFISHPTTFPGSYPFPVRGISPNLPYSGSQPLGAIPMGSVGNVHALPGHQLDTSPGQKTEALSGIDDRAGSQLVGNRLDAWTAHKSEAGVVYYYNSVTGQSTYEKPPGFGGEPDKVPVQPIPVSMEDLPGTDWALVSTNDGKKYYYNNKTKVSSWQIPAEVKDLGKKLEERAMESVASVPSADFTEKGSDLSSLSAPAISNGGRDAASLKTTNFGSSALDLVKKKLHDSGVPVSSTSTSEANGGKASEVTPSGESGNGTGKIKDASGAGELSDSSSDSEDEDSGPSKEECFKQFKEMLKERGIAPFSKWEKELPKIIFDPRFKAIPSHSVRRSLFEQYVKTRAEEERREKRAAHKAAIEGFRQLLDEASTDIDQHTDYHAFKKKWGNDLRFEALERKEREAFLNERVLSLKRTAEQKAQEIRAAAASDFKTMLREREVSLNSHWSKVKDSLRNDPRYRSVAREDREAFYYEYIAELKAAQRGDDHEMKARDEEDKLRERERELRKRKEREVQEVERVRQKIRRKEASSSYQALLVEKIRDPEASWTESKPKLERDPQKRASNPDLDPADKEKLFRDHIKTLYERCVHDFKALLVEALSSEAASQQTEDGKTVLDSWSAAKQVLKPDIRYSKMPRRDREVLWRRYAEDISRKQKQENYQEEKQRDYKT
ncbi:FF domain superfamily [Arabidopsis suecica]|uniref:FF domain superfamily n=1 Tax=Arabidopsis suecica TaxID=45249 RepID=A0A8T2B5R4_ARASU|nr:FF domain superfamily [Arabidopsis suecica]